MDNYDVDNIVTAIKMEVGSETISVKEEGESKLITLIGDNISRISPYLLEILFDLSSHFTAKNKKGTTVMVFTA